MHHVKVYDLLATRPLKTMPASFDKSYILRHSLPEPCRVLPLAAALARRIRRNGASVARIVESSCSLQIANLAMFPESVRCECHS